MTLGEKIKTIRTSKGITQRSLADGIVTRNMLSQIECSKASPSLETLTRLAERLEVSVSYLISDEEKSFFYEKERKIDRIKELYRQSRFSDCIKECEKLSERDDEINLILAISYYNIGKRNVLFGALNKGQGELEKSINYSNETIYDTSAINNSALIYVALCKNVKSPLLEFDRETFEKTTFDNLEYELYKYITKDIDYQFKNETLKNHAMAKKRIAARDYHGALDILLKIEANKKDYNAHVFFNVYTDIEACYKQLLDFENAYRYSSKRLSLMEGFKK